MDKKLTLSLNATVIDRAKSYASEQGTSLSRMVENYLSAVINTSEEEQEVEITPLVQSLIGIATVPEDFDWREERTNYLKDKHK